MRKQEELEAVRQENKIVQGENLPPQTPEEFERTGNIFRDLEG